MSAAWLIAAALLIVGFSIVAYAAHADGAEEYDALIHAFVGGSIAMAGIVTALVTAGVMWWVS